MPQRIDICPITEFWLRHPFSWTTYSTRPKTVQRNSDCAVRKRYPDRLLAGQKGLCNSLQSLQENSWIECCSNTKSTSLKILAYFEVRGILTSRWKPRRPVQLQLYPWISAYLMTLSAAQRVQHPFLGEFKEQRFWMNIKDISQGRTFPAFARKEGTHKTSTGVFELPAKTKA